MLPSLPQSLLNSWLQVSTDAIASNFNTFRALTAHKNVFAVIKADAYGHGAVKIAQHLEAHCQPTKFCVARFEEAIELRNASITTPILVLLAPFAEQVPMIVENNLECIVFTEEQIADVAGQAQKYAQKVRVHLKTDVGMGRVGCRPDEAPHLARLIAQYEWLTFEGVMSHLPCADSPPARKTQAMLGIFGQIKERLSAQHTVPQYFHIANSATIMDYPEGHFDAVRLGISLYGQQPSDDVVNVPELKPAMSLYSRIAFVKHVPAGVGISYGHLFATERESLIATIPLGYADGIPRSASGKFSCFVNGRPARQIGRVCMDQFMLDVTDIPEVKTADIVTVFGLTPDSQNQIAVEVLASQAGTIGYEITTRIGKRLTKFFI